MLTYFEGRKSVSGDKISDVKSSSMASEQLISLLWSLASRRQSAHFRKPHITKLMALVPWAPLIATFISHDFIFILTIGVFTSFETAFCHVAQAVRGVAEDGLHSPILLSASLLGDRCMCPGLICVLPWTESRTSCAPGKLSTN